MTDAEAMALQPPTADRPMTFQLPSSARDWLQPGDRWWLWLPSVLATHDELSAWDTLAEWDALTGRLVREWHFGDGEHARKARADALAVAAEAERIAVRLGARA